MENGGGACDLVAQAFLDQVPMADIAIQNSGSCVSDIAKGDFTIKDGMELLPKTHTLVMLEMTGQAVVLLLEQALSGVWGGSKCGGYSYSGTYPYSAGLRYRVNATAKYMHRVTNVEVNERLDQTSWRSIEWDEVYTVVANSYIASGGDGYWVFARVPKELVINTGKDATETFAEYASEHTILFDPSEDEYSTQEFIPPV
jgi:5'-nucleotidase